MAKLADVSVPFLLFGFSIIYNSSIGRGETFIAVTVLYVLGYVSAPHEGGKTADISV